MNKSLRVYDLLENIMSGEWGTEATGKNDAFVIRTTNFTNKGVIDFSKEVVKRNIEQRKVDAKKLIKGDIIIEKSGGSLEQPVGRVIYFGLDEDEGTYLCNNFTSVLRPKKEIVDSKYLLYFLFNQYQRRTVLKFQNQTTGIINLKLDNYLKDVEISLPLLEEQKKIARVLDKAQSLIDKRKEAITKLDELVQAVFLDMFGDYRINDKGFEECKVSDVVTNLEAGWSPGGETRLKLANEYGVLTTTAVTLGEFNSEAYKVPSLSIESEKKLVHPTKNSILVSRMNTRELVGAACIIEQDYNKLFLPDRIWKLTLNQKMVEPYYFIKAVQGDGFREQVSKEATGTSGSMLNISQGKYGAIKLVLPPIELQKRFAKLYLKIRIEKSLKLKQLSQLESNFNALLQQAFKGELSIKDEINA
jgi:type I restriction enzyme, S subunit